MYLFINKTIINRIFAKKNMSIGQKIKDARIKKGLTQEDLAAKTDISVRTIQRIENEEVAPRTFYPKNPCNGFGNRVRRINTKRHRISNRGQ